jgi:acylphosphatase
MKTIKVEFGIWASNGQDGSVSIYLLKDPDKIEEFLDEQDVDQRFSEDIKTFTLKINPKTGKVIGDFEDENIKEVYED